MISKEFYRKGKWSINTSHGWKIRATTKAMEDLLAACLDVVKNQDRFCAVEEMICACVYVRKRERESRDTRCIDTENTQGKVY